MNFFYGKIYTDTDEMGGSSGSQDKGSRISISNVIWRGSKLENTDSMIGLIIYSGRDSKIV